MKKNSKTAQIETSYPNKPINFNNYTINKSSDGYKMQKKSEIFITKEQIKKYMHLKQREAAKELGISPRILARKFKELFPEEKWPRNMTKKLTVYSAPSSNGEITQSTPTPFFNNESNSVNNKMQLNHQPKLWFSQAKDTSDITLPSFKELEKEVEQNQHFRDFLQPSG